MAISFSKPEYLLHPALPLPKRVSRVYPILTFVLILASGSFLFAWQSTAIELDRLPKVQEKNQQLEKQIESLTSDRDNQKAQVLVYKQKVTETAAQLAELEKQVKLKNDELATKEAQLKKQEEQLTKNASELANLRGRPPLFSFANKSSLEDIEAKKADVKALVTSAYGYIEELYGEPYLLNSIKITFVDTFSIAGAAGEIVIENSSKGISIDIHLKDFNKASFQDNNTVIHEIIHGFHGLAVIDCSALEEGMTVATTDAVMKEMIADGKLPNFPHLYLRTSPTDYQTWNENLRVPSDNQLFYSNPEVAKVYQLIGTAWYKLYEEDRLVFKKINATYYPKVAKGQVTENSLILDTIRSVIPKVKGQPIDSYLSTNRAFYPN